MPERPAGIWEQRPGIIVPGCGERLSQKENRFGYTPHCWISRLRLFRKQLCPAGPEGHSHRRHRSYLCEDVLSYCNGVRPLDHFRNYAIRVANHFHERCLFFAVGVYSYKEARKSALTLRPHGSTVPKCVHGTVTG